MLVVNVTGGNQTQRTLVEDVVMFTLKSLLPRIRNIEIDVALKKLPGDVAGYCLELDSHREFEIELDKTLSIRDLVLTVCHEMVHVKQYFRKEMDACGRRWKKKEISNDTPYMELPWEKEAYRMQAKLAKAYWLAEE
jgi:hypothetical protein